ncbi:MAG: hypothetical protein CMF72_26015 [Mameliella sp.]|nr:hypothetical protein [Mameliella sp.]
MEAELTFQGKQVDRLYLVLMIRLVLEVQFLLLVTFQLMGLSLVVHLVGGQLIAQRALLSHLMMLREV